MNIGRMGAPMFPKFLKVRWRFIWNRTRTEA
jgi:hypothetical protein